MQLGMRHRVGVEDRGIRGRDEWASSSRNGESFCFFLCEREGERAVRGVVFVFRGIGRKRARTVSWDRGCVWKTDRKRERERERERESERAGASVRVRETKRETVVIYVDDATTKTSNVHISLDSEVLYLNSSSYFYA